MNRMKKSVVAAGLTAGLIGGGAAGVILGSGGVSGAQESTDQTEQTAPPAAEAPAAGESGSERPDPSTKLGETLAPLVEDGTITQAQADKVIETLVAARPEGGRGHGGGPGGGHGRGGGGFGSEAVAGVLGLTTDELRAALSEGQSLAQVAESKGIAVDKVVEAIVTERTERLAEKVAAGDITQEQMDEKLAELLERVTDQVNRTAPARGERGPAPEDAPADAPAEDAPADDGAGG